MQSPSPHLAQPSPTPPDHANLMKSLLTARLKQPDEKSSKPGEGSIDTFGLQIGRRISHPLSPSTTEEQTDAPLFANEKHLFPFLSPSRVFKEYCDRDLFDLNTSRDFFYSFSLPNLWKFSKEFFFLFFFFFFFIS